RQGTQKGADMITLYRAVSPKELDDVVSHQAFRPDPGFRSMDAKWFSETLEGAERWGQIMFDEFHIVSTTIPKNVADSMYKVRNLDNIANARSAMDDVLDLFNQTMRDLKIIR
ncbi:MAG: hypothetical protein ACPG8W_10155, partial [Candidatus Promineifilaceae bacterium]